MKLGKNIFNASCLHISKVHLDLLLEDSLIGWCKMNLILKCNRFLRLHLLTLALQQFGTKLSPLFGFASQIFQIQNHFKLNPNTKIACSVWALSFLFQLCSFRLFHFSFYFFIIFRFMFFRNLFYALSGFSAFYYTLFQFFR
jgi:hypothetical protein